MDPLFREEELPETVDIDAPIPGNPLVLPGILFSVGLIKANPRYGCLKILFFPV